MTVLTIPFQPDTEALLGHAHGHRLTASARLPHGELMPLNVTGLRFGYDEQRAPRLAGSATVVLPDPGRLDGLDPRALLRLQLQVGYVRPGGREDVHTVAEPVVVARQLARPGPGLTLPFGSDEQLVTDNRATVARSVSGAVADAVDSLLLDALPAAPLWVERTLSGALSAPLELAVGQDYWPLLDDLVDRVDGDLWHDGLTGWHMTPRPLLAEAAATLTTGPGGTITDSDVTLHRGEGWANAVLITYQWTDAAGNRQVIHGYAEASSGPFATGAVGRVVLPVDRELPTTQAEADAAAASILRRRLSYGRSFEVTAVAAYWLRPGHTVSVQLPTGPASRLLVSSVDFEPALGEMRLRLRLPDDASTITTGG